jgi:hypothetical protein
MGMNDQELIEQAALLRPTYCDGFGAYRKINGVLRCVGFILDGGATLNLIVSLAGADQAQIDTKRVLCEEPTPNRIAIWTGTELAH